MVQENPCVKQPTKNYIADALIEKIIASNDYGSAQANTGKYDHSIERLGKYWHRRTLKTQPTFTSAISENVSIAEWNNRDSGEYLLSAHGFVERWLGHARRLQIAMIVWACRASS